jgi:glycine/D-amino acid oxidase-like deaminating enzyme
VTLTKGDPVENRVVDEDDAYRRYSLWLDTVDDDLTPRPPLETDDDVDVAIVGAGYTGLWTAYYLASIDPSLRIAVLEREIAGFGASGRNGGWCSALFAASREKIARRHGRSGAIAMQQAMFDTVTEVGRVLEHDGIDAHYRRGGTLIAATTPAQFVRLRTSVDHERSWGISEHDYRWLDAAQARRRVDVAGCLGAVFTPHCAAVHPGRLVRGLARRVEDLGVRVYERSPVQSIEPGAVRTPHARLRAEVVIRATEGYTTSLPRQRRTLLPLYSLMIATEPLERGFWDQVGWSRGETFADGRHLIIYALRTRDDRIAIGGRGAPYHFGSRIQDGFDHSGKVFSGLRSVLETLFPSLGPVAITHQWGGPIGVPRDWYSSVGYDRDSGLGWAGGYVGDGVSTSNLAGRTLADLICGRDSDLVHLPWVQHRSRKWEIEPLRWLGTNLALRMMANADRVEARTGKPARRAELVGRLIGI